MIKYIGNNNIASINYQGAEIKKLFLGNNLYYWNLETVHIPIIEERVIYSEEYCDDDYNYCQDELHQIRYDKGEWETTATTKIIIEEKSQEHCGYNPNPYEYIDWIQSLGGYFDTHYVPKANTSVEFMFDKKMVDAITFFNGRVAAGNNHFGFIAPTTQYSFEINNKRNTFTPTNEKEDRNVAKITPTGCYFNDSKVISYSNYTTQFTNSIGLFCAKTNGTYGAINTSGNKMYYFKIWEGDTLIHHFTPAIRKEDNKVGLVDLVTNEFLLPIVDNFLTPEVEDTKYAKFDGASYFNTSVSIGTVYTTVDCDIYLQTKPTTTVCPFGARSSSYSFMPLHTTAADGWRMNIGNTTITALTTNDDSKYDIMMRVSGTSTSRTLGYTISENGVRKATTSRTASWSTNLNTRTLWIGAMNDSQNFPSYFTQYIKSFKIWKGIDLQNYFVFKEVDGVVKMYDVINKTYINQLGSGQVTLVDIPN